MKTLVRSMLMLAAGVALAASTCVAQSAGAATYKAKCQMCHGAKGEADTPTAKMMKVLPLSSPEMKKLSEADMIKATTDGKGKMPAYKGKLTEAQITEAVKYFRSLK
ncbi:MAG TPA: cytochrome c [Terracidiphilus sp.]|nr:cytochrome c [Terracidiphilus sp.]